MNAPLVNDLSEHVMARISRVMRQALELLEEDGEQAALMISVTASMVMSFADAMTARDPERWEGLDENERAVAAISILAAAVGVEPSADPERVRMMQRAAASIRCRRR